MRRGTGLSAPSSAPPSTNTGLRSQSATQEKRPVDELSARTPRGTIEQLQPSLQRTLESQPQPLPPPNNLSAPQTTPSRPKSPLYLTGKNPYGRILDNVEHPYRERRAPESGPPSQLGSNMGGRPRTSGSFRFVTRPTPPPAPERKVSVDGTPRPSSLPPARPPQKAVSVKDAKSLFETKASESRKAPPFPSARTATIAKDASTDSGIKQQPHKAGPVMRSTGSSEEARPAKERPTRREISSATLPIPRPQTEAAERRQSAQRTNPFTRAKADEVRPRLVMRTATGFDDGERPVRRRSSPKRSAKVAEWSNSKSLYAAETSASARRRSTSVSTEPKPQAKPLRGVQRSIVQRNRFDDLSAGTRSTRASSAYPEHPLASDETVRRRSNRKSSTAESQKASPSTDPKRTGQAQLSRTGNAVRRFASQFDRGIAGKDQQRDSRQSPFTERQSHSATWTKRSRR
ncbi:uncharacterized protein N0V89_003143 [Didymosphaeria variabile]|uniref:Uncharacterized protein n=1 Tax=Didymosphaeria variabile TaxID=1932322 RepID=A0A9W8XU07_9PLEO|nr:uncharacterized protein N0V89_003143 [Didymosphaeria variabile]KAJ4358559.1 hypothetical protein N0V89_003143 [Didymosphaeria variabile]